MVKQERKLIYNWDGRAAYWQYRQDAAEYEEKQSYEQVRQDEDDSWVLLLWVLGTIGILVVLAKTTLWSFF
jgi:hypothetical protein